MRPLLKSATKTSQATERKAKESGSSKSNQKSTIGTSKETVIPQKSEPPRTFQTISTSTPRRLNDIITAPPQFTKLPRGAGKANNESGKLKASAKGKAGEVLSMAQQLQMEKEREGAIERYRQLKRMRMSKEGSGDL